MQVDTPAYGLNTPVGIEITALRLHRSRINSRIFLCAFELPNNIPSGTITALLPPVRKILNINSRNNISVFFVLILKKRSNIAGLENTKKISGHSLRIGAITQARMNGVPTHEIMAQSGHKTTQMIDRYTKLSNIRETSAAKKI